jgi:opacity protein-like surface antigen
MYSKFGIIFGWFNFKISQMQRILLVLLFLFTVNIACFSQEGKLEKGKESLNKSASTSKGSIASSSTKGDSRRSRNPNDESYFSFFFAGIFIDLFAYTVYGVAIESPFEFNGRMHDAEIANYPYEKTFHGNFIYTDSINYKIARLDITNSFVIENSNLYGNNFGIDFRFLKRFGLEFDYLYLREKSNTNRDQFSLYSALINYHRIRTQKLDVWFGLGMMHVGSDVNKTGFGVGIGAEWFVVKPISAKVSHKFTNINNQEVNNTKLLLKYHLKNYHISSGYEHFKIGVAKINAFSIGVGASF